MVGLTTKKKAERNAEYPTGQYAVGSPLTEYPLPCDIETARSKYQVRHGHRVDVQHPNGPYDKGEHEHGPKRLP
jgi:hypothetical protein